MAIDRVAVLRNAEKLLRQGKLEAAIAEYLQVVEDQPRDWNTANILGDLYLRAGKSDKAVEQFVRVAEHLKHDGFLPKAAAVYKKILRIRPDDDYAMLQAGDLAARQGVLVDARAYWNAVHDRRLAQGDAKGAAEIKVRLGTLDNTDFEARTAAARARIDTGDRTGGIADLLAVATELVDKDRRGEGLELLMEAALFDPDNPKIRAQLWAAYSTPADAAASRGDWAQAAATLQDFVSQVPNHLQALMRLVEVCFDGGLDAAMTAAQSQLADAYLATGSPAEARVISEDLMTREPSEPAHVDQLRRALTMLGEADPDAVIAERRKLTAVEEEPMESEPGLKGGDAPVPGPPESARLQAPAPDADVDEAIEIDLSDLLLDFKPGTAPVIEPPAETGEPPAPRDLDEVFDRFREEAALGQSGDARSEYERGLQLRDSGRVDDSIPAFETASREPRFRFHAAAALGRIHRERGALTQAVEWLERAAQAPAPGADEAHALFFDLAEMLESLGEVERALAVCLELQADAGDYRDLSARIHRLSQVRARG